MAFIFLQKDNYTHEPPHKGELEAFYLEKLNSHSDSYVDYSIDQKYSR